MASNINPGGSFDDSQSFSNGNVGDSLQSEIELLLRARHNRVTTDQGKDLNIYRSGSAPPTVQGSLRAVGSLFRNSEFLHNGIGDGSNVNGILSEDDILSHPAYLSYYYLHVNINPRLPPPLLSKEDWRVAQRFQGGPASSWGLGNRRNNRLVGDTCESPSLFSMQSGSSVRLAENDFSEFKKTVGRELPSKASAEWLERTSDVVGGFSGSGESMRSKSFADILQEGLDKPVQLSRPASRNSLDNIVDDRAISHPHPLQSQDTFGFIEPSGAGMLRGQTVGTAISHSFAPAVGSSLSRSTTPEPQFIGKSLGHPGLPPVASRVGSTLHNGPPSGISDIADIDATLSCMTLSEDNHVQPQIRMSSGNLTDTLFNVPDFHNQSIQHQIVNKCRAEKLACPANYVDLATANGNIPDPPADISFDGRVNFPRRTSSSANLYSRWISSGHGPSEGSNVHYHQRSSEQSIHFNGDGYFINGGMNSAIDNNLATGSVFANNVTRAMNRSLYQEGPHLSSSDPRLSAYLNRNYENSKHIMPNPSSMSRGRNKFGTRGDLLELQQEYLQALHARQRQHYELPLLGKSGSSNNRYYDNQLYGPGMQYAENQLENSMLAFAGDFGNPMFQDDRFLHANSMMKNPIEVSIGSWHSEVAKMNGIISSFLEDFKNNKTRSFELSDIVDHVVDFSTDQYGSRFIQQKLENASVEEKMMIFPEIIPHARNLMTDVFGNYVIQKFFEHGSESQRKELASQLIGHVLPLSLQMYGCRVIQKALEVVDLVQKTQMARELDGSIMKCVRDQNGNHVVQKCIECVPQDKIQFIISSFHGQVVALSTHPYGCRVIQRVLEHCDDENTQQFIMDEIMHSVSTLAQDQYGNYVIQHVLQCGKPNERSAIISKLAGQIVKMSQQKFASNVIEKCLAFGSAEERQLLVNEILGSTDENEPLQAMMKDAFGNYVVQKVLETCDDQSLELILSRIKVHLNSLKKYTYGKHIVARIEKLIVTGERRIGLLSSLTA